MPVLEAMASGVPVITSNNTALLEAAGNAAVLVQADSVDSIARGLEGLLTDGAASETLVRRGLEQARKFTWDQTAQVLRDSYFRLLD